MNAELVSVDGLDRQVTALAEARKPSEIFKLLLEGARMAVPRTAIFLIRQGQIKGWGALGYPAPATENQRSLVAPAADGWIGEIVSGSQTGLVLRAGQGLGLDFAQPAASETVAIAVRVRGRAIAVLTGERSPAEGPWFPATLSLLVRVAQLRLELDLAHRKLQSAGLIPPPAPEAPKPAAASPQAPAAQATAVAPAAPAAPAGDPTEKLTTARRYAQLVATDIRLYNEDAVAQGRRQGDLVDRLGDQLGRGKETFLRRHGDLGPTAIEILHEAYVDVLAGGDKNLLPTSTLE